MNYTIVNLETWQRKEHFYAFKTYAQCGFSMTVELDITEFLCEVKAKEYQFYPAIIHKISTVVNEFSEFRMAMKNDELIVWDEVHPGYTIFHKDTETFSSLWSEYHRDLVVFSAHHLENMAKFGDDLSYFPQGVFPENIFYVSMIPWVIFTNFNLQFGNLENLFAPVFTLGKYFKKEGRTSIPLSIQVHHAVCDGFHASRFINRLQQLCLSTEI